MASCRLVKLVRSASAKVGIRPKRPPAALVALGVVSALVLATIYVPHALISDSTVVVFGQQVNLPIARSQHYNDGAVGSEPLVEAASRLGYELAAPNIAHWHPHESDIRTTLFVEKSWYNKTKDKHVLGSHPDISCEWLPLDSKGIPVAGEALFTFGSEESYKVDRGVRFISSKFKDSILNPNATVRQNLCSLFLRCRLPKHVAKGDGGLRVVLKDPYMRKSRIDATLTVQALPHFPVAKTAPIVCSRFIVGDISAAKLAFFVEHNVAQGFPKTLFYASGLSFMRDRYVLEPLRRAGHLDVINVLEPFQDLYGIDSQTVTLRVRALAQWFVRMDCLHRLRPLNPAYIVNLDVDEFPVPGSNSSPDLTFASFLLAQSRLWKPPAVLSFILAQPIRNSCSEAISLEEFQSVGAKDHNLHHGGRLNKYVHDPFLNENKFAIHYVRGRHIESATGRNMGKSRKVPEQTFYFQHLRCLNKVVEVMQDYEQKKLERQISRT